MNARRGLAALALAASLAGPATALAAPASLPDVEDEVMCPVCGVPLNIAESPQAERERDFIRALIAQGRDKGQIKRALVAQYGRNVLALPHQKGADVVPIALGGGLALLLGFGAVRWRRRSAAATTAGTREPALSAADSERLDRDLRERS